VSDLLSSGAGLAAATPWGAALGALGSALGTTPSSQSGTGNTTAGPVNLNISGFGSKSEGSASATGQPSGYGFTAGAVGSSSWVLPAAILGAAVVLALLLRR